MKKTKKAKKARSRKSNPSPKRASSRSARRTARVRSMRSNGFTFKRKGKGHGRRARGRRRNPEKFGFKELAIVAAVGAVGLFGAYYVSAKDLLPTSLSPQWKAVLVGAAGLGGGYALSRVSTAAGAGLAGGVTGFSLFSLAQFAYTPAPTPPPAASTPAPEALGALQLQQQIHALQILRGLQRRRGLGGLEAVSRVPLGALQLQSPLNGLRDDMTIT